MAKEYELKFNVDNKNLEVRVTNFKNTKQINMFLKSVKCDWS